MSNDPFAEFKSKQKELWSLGNFGDMAVFTTPVAGHLVRFAGVQAGKGVLDVAEDGVVGRSRVGLLEAFARGGVEGVQRFEPALGFFLEVVERRHNLPFRLVPRSAGQGRNERF